MADRDDREIGEQAVKTFELSQTLNTHWKTAGIDAKHSIQAMLYESIGSNHNKLRFLARKPFALLEIAELSFELERAGR